MVMCRRLQQLRRFTSLADVQPATERTDTATAADGQSSSSSKTARNFFTVVIIVVFGLFAFQILAEYSGAG